LWWLFARESVDDTWYVISVDVVLILGSLYEAFLILDRNGIENSLISLGGLLDIDGRVNGAGSTSKLYQFRTLRKLPDTRHVDVVFSGRSHGFVTRKDVRPATPAELIAALGK
jgi:hypothetical protein